MFTFHRVYKECQPDGTFLDQIEKCKPIPCTHADIEEVTPIEGDFITEATGDYPVNGEIYFRCEDSSKARNSFTCDAVEC